VSLLVFLFRNWLLQALASGLLHNDRLTGLEFIAIGAGLDLALAVLYCTGKTADL